MIGKLIVHAEDRPSAIRRMLRALDEMHVAGVKTIVPLHKELLQDARVQSGDVHTGYVAQFLSAR